MQRRNIMFLMISLSLILLLGSSYALLRSTKVGSNPYVINVGTLQVTFDNEQTDSLELENMYPMSDKEGSSQSNELGFTVKNTGTVASYYDVYLEETSTNPEFKSVIRFISNKNSQGYNNPKTLNEDKYIDVGGYLEPNKSSSYKVKAWLDYNAGNEYMDETFTAKVVVNSFQESDYAKDVVKSKLVKYSESSKETFTGGLVAVNTDGDLYNETESSQEIREYRYSGPNVNNYVTFNNEIWRIVGVFKNENNIEYVKIVRNDLLKDIFPETYTINKVEFKIKFQTSTGASWNIKTDGSGNNDWSSAGLQYYLNSEEDDNKQKGYLSYLDSNSKLMIENLKYYLGNVSYMNIDNITDGIIDSPKEAYVNERAIKECDEIDGKKVGSNKNSGTGSLTFSETPNCRVRENYMATWTGKIGLLYPSDYGYSVRNANGNWDKYLADFASIKNLSWMSTLNIISWEWFISPSNRYNYAVSHYDTNGFVDAHSNNGNIAVRPCLYLKSNVKITSGDGSSKNPYQLEI